MLNIYHYPARSALPYKHVVLKRRATLAEEKADSTEHDGRMDESLSRTRRLLVDYAYCNRFDLFGTLTFDPAKIDRMDYALVRKKLCGFFNNYRKRYDKWFRYMMIPEFHKDGAVHFHGLFTMPSGDGFRNIGACTPLTVQKRVEGPTGEVLEFVANTRHYMAWPAYAERYGYFSAGVIKDYDRCISYIQKYITKDLVNSDHAKGSRLLLKSNNLNKPELVYSALEGVSLYRPDFENEFCAVAWKDDHQTAQFYHTLQYEVDHLLDADDLKGRPFEYEAPVFLPEAEQLEIV